MNFKRKELWIPSVVGLLILFLVAGVLIYRSFFRPEEWRLYDQIKSKPEWIEWVYVKMGILDEDLLPYDGDHVGTIKNLAFDKLSKLGEKSISTCIALFDDRKGAVRSSAIECLLNVNCNKKVKPLISCLENEKLHIRLCATVALARIGDETAVKPLINCLNDESSRIRANAIFALGNIGDFRAVKPVIKFLKDNSLNLRILAARALGKIKDKRAIEDLIKCMNDKNDLMRDCAHIALIDCGKMSVKPLIENLQNKHDWIRFYGSHALGEIGDERAVKPLINSLQDKNTKVRLAAAEALGSICDQRAIQPLTELMRKEKSEKVRKAAVEALKKLGHPVTPADSKP